MTKALNRRRFLTLSAAAAGIAAFAGEAVAAPYKVEWQGTALGADATLTFYHHDRQQAQSLLNKVRRALQHFEGQFSLFRRDSALVTLNRTGTLAQPSKAMLDLLDQAASLHQATEGAFDVTVQPLWRLYGQHFAAGNHHPPSRAAIDAAHARVGMHLVSWDRHQVRFAKPGMGVTLNGIAQGYITDRILLLLAAEGLTDVLVNMGEYRGIGGHPDGQPWRLGVGASDLIISLKDQAVASSQGQAMQFDATGRWHHIFDPKQGTPARNSRMTTTVLAPTATLADGLSTALTVLAPDLGDRVVQQWPYVQVIRT